MRFHWYWPFARAEELELARSTVRPGEEIVAEVIDRSAAPPAGSQGGVTVRRDLPDVNRAVGRLAWVPSRASTYTTRAAVRRRQWRSNDFDLFHLHYVNRFTDTFARFPQPLVLSVHDVMPHQLRLGQRAEHRMLAHLYQRPDALLVHHARLADDLHLNFGIPFNKIFVVPHQVFPTDSAAESTRPDGPPRMLFFGALRPNKGLEVLDQAMAMLGDRDLHLTIAGRGDDPVEALARDMAMRDSRVTAEIGFASLNRKRELFREASLVVLPYTEFSSQSGVLHDAYGHGRPVVVSDVGALGRTVRDDGTGMVVAPRDAAGLASAIMKILEPGRWAAAATASRQVASDRSHLAVGTLLREVYDNVLK